MPRIERVPEVEHRTGLSRVTLWRLSRAGLFPAPRRIGKRSIGWLETEVSAWIEGRAARQAA